MLDLVYEPPRASRVDQRTAQSFEALQSPVAPLRCALRALASAPDFYRAPHEAIAALRPRVEHARGRLALDRKIGGARAARLRGWTRLADGAVIGLAHLARVCVDAAARSLIPPFAVIAVGEYGAGSCNPDTALDLQYLLPTDEESWERGGRIIAFMRIGLAELGLAHGDAVGTAAACARLAGGDPAGTARFATARFLSGQFGLYAELVRMLPRATGLPARKRERSK